MRVRTAAIFTLALASSVCRADNLHVACIMPTTCSSNSTDLSLSNNPSTFEFGLKGNLTGTGTGDFFLIALVPNNEKSGFGLKIDASNANVTAALPKDDGAFTGNSGTELKTVLDDSQNGFTNMPNGHPLSAYLGATQIVDPGATGFEVFTYAFGLVNFSSTTNPIFSLETAAPVGTVFTALATTHNLLKIIDDSPNSEGLLVTTKGISTPEPAYGGLLVVVLAGLLFRRRRLAVS